MKLLIAGDLSIQDRAARMSWSDTEKEHAFQSVKNIIENCDYSIVNLESPVTDSAEAILKDGPTLRNNPKVFEIIDYCGFNAVTLANNHLKDYGEQGVADTLAECKTRGITSLGAGHDLQTARKPLVIDLGGG